jgi:phosphatidylglycerophosphate synthase
MAVETIADETGFRAARRELTSLLAPLEKRCLIRIAQAVPAWVTSDHLTGLALAAMLSAGLCYWLSSVTPVALWLVNVSLAINWFGDSLDGTLARVRRQERPRYGFYVDHVVDLFGAVFLLGGLALSGYMSAYIALGLLVAYLMLCVEIFLATHCVGTFRMSFFRIGPTELRILLAIGNVALIVQPTTTLFGRTFNLFDVSGVIGAAGLVVTVVVSAVSNTRALYRAEPVAR